MTTGEMLIDLWIDLQVMLALAALVALLLAAAVRRLAAAPTEGLRLSLWRAALAAGVATPPLMLAWAEWQGPGLGAMAPLNVTDALLSHYLQGNIRISPEAVEGALGWREATVRALAAGAAPWAQAVLAAVAAGAAWHLGRLLRDMLRLRRVVGESYLWRRIGRVDLRLSESAAIPFATRGPRRRVIVLPVSMLARGGDLHIALAHELQHLRQRDVEGEFAVAALAPLFFANPAFWLARRRIEVLRELACDRRLMARRRWTLRAYADCLLTVTAESLARGRRPARLPVVGLVPARVRRGGQLCRRLTALADSAPAAERRRSPALVALPVAAAVLLAGLSLQRSGEWSQDRLMLSTIVNLERLEALNAAAARTW
jgi:hypothetical protein